jgi:hypothetical protein
MGTKTMEGDGAGIVPTEEIRELVAEMVAGCEQRCFRLGYFSAVAWSDGELSEELELQMRARFQRLFGRPWDPTCS